MSDLRHQLGQAGETFALRHLERLGCALVARNHRTRFGEIDLIVLDREALVFVEVKTRRVNGRAVPIPWEALGERKRSQVRRMAAAYLATEPDRPIPTEIRFDAVGVLIDGRDRLVALDHLEAAF